MRQFNGFDEAKKNAEAMGGERLPAGAYVCEILGVKYQKGEDGKSDSIALQFDIAEGEYKGFFKKQYENSTQENKKYKGKTIIYCPVDDGSERDNWTKNSFAKWTNSFESSNEGYAWDWHEEKWKGLVVGIAFGDTGTKIDGKDIVYTEPRYAVPVKSVRDKKVKLPQFKSKNGYGEGSSTSTDFVNIGAGVEEELPWD